MAHCTTATLRATLPSLFVVVDSGRAWDQRVMRRGIRAFAYLVNLNDGVTLTNAWRIAWAMLRRPLTLGEAAACSLYRLLRMPRVLLREATAALYRRRICIRPLLLVVHHFMGSTELDTNWGRPRLATCVFKLSVDGQLLSMCEVNATGIREQLTDAALR